MKRVFDPNELEFIDREQPATPAFENELRHLEEINRYFGSHRLIRKFLSAWLNPGRCYRVLDLCTSSGDIPRVMVEWARRADITLRIEPTSQPARSASSINPTIIVDTPRNSAGRSRSMTRTSIAGS